MMKHLNSSILELISLEASQEIGTGREQSRQADKVYTYKIQGGSREWCVGDATRGSVEMSPNSEDCIVECAQNPKL